MTEGTVQRAGDTSDRPGGFPVLLHVADEEDDVVLRQRGHSDPADTGNDVDAEGAFVLLLRPGPERLLGCKPAEGKLTDRHARRSNSFAAPNASVKVLPARDCLT